MRWRAWCVELLGPVVIWFYVAFLSGAQAWTTLDTPDSEFHASMAIFAGDVTDRTYEPAYFWTRLGYIAPGHLLTKLFGPLEGLEIHRLLILGFIIASTYAIARRFTQPPLASVLTGLVSLNTVILGYLGNPYPSSTIFAGMLILIALAIWGPSRTREFIAGVVAGWLVMTSPYGMLLSLAAYVIAVILRDSRLTSPLSLARAAVLGLAGTATSFLVFLGIGQLLFPGFDWIDTYISWNSGLNQADYIDELYRWTRDPSMLVPAVAAVISLVAVTISPRNPAFRLAAGMSIGVPLFALSYWLLIPNNYLEIPHYQAMLWPTALIAIVLITCSNVRGSIRPWILLLIGGAGFGAVTAAGHVNAALGTWQARSLSVLLVIICTALLMRKEWFLVILGAIAFFAGSQILQNSRDNFGVSQEFMYVHSFVKSNAEETLRASIEAQRWLIESTSPGDRVLLWIDDDWSQGPPELLPMAAFQIWGVNESGRGAVMTPDILANWEFRQSRMIAMYALDKQSVIDFWATIPREVSDQAPECRTFPWLGDREAHLCLIRLGPWADPGE